MSQLSTLYRSLVAGTICAVLVLAFGIADAALFFRGNLQAFFPVAVGFAVFGFLLQVLVIGTLTRLRYTHGTSQEASLVILAAMLFDVQARVTGDALLPTALMLIVISGVTLGVALLLCGAFKLGRYIRLMPFAMVAGFLAGSGLLMVSFSVAVLHGESVGVADLVQGASPQAIWKVLAGVAMGLVLIGLSAARWSEYTLPAVIVGGVVAFHVVVAQTPISIDALVADNWTMATDAVSVAYQPLTADLFRQVDWQTLAVVSPQLVSLVAVCIFANLIKISSLELMMRQRVDENRELRVAGYAGLLSGALAVAPGFHGLSNSSIILRLSGNAKIAAVVTAAVTVGVLALAGDSLILMPRFVFGAILLWVGYAMIHDSLVANVGKVRTRESVVTAAIALTVTVLGPLPGLAFGVLCGLVMFVTDYAQQETVRSFQSAAELHSNVDRGTEARQWLNRHGESVRVVRLHSYLFFGSAARSVEAIMRHLDTLTPRRVEILVLDFSRVVGIDSTALRAFQRLALRTETDHTVIWAAAAPPDVRLAFEKDGNGAVARFFQTLDFALEAAEEQLLGSRTDA
ncbi:MAG: SulP family inorganic anion transporter, partial [Pseudomonadota bacterium]